MDLACSVAFVLNFDRMDCSVLENNWALTFSFYPSSSTSTLSCSRRRNPPPAWTPLRRRKSLASKFWSTYFDNFNNCPAVQDTKFYLGIGIPKKRFRLFDASERFPYDLRSFDLLRCRFVFFFYISYLFLSIFLNFIHCFIRTLFQYFLRGVLCTTRNKTEKIITGKKLFTNAFCGSDAPIEAVAKI